MMVNCKIGKIKLKNGCELKVFPNERNNISRVSLDWGEVVFRAYDDVPLTVADCCYMADSAKRIIADGFE